MKILVTGGCGFIGSNVAKGFLSNNNLVTVYDTLVRPGVYKNMMWLVLENKGIRFRQWDVKDYDRLLRVVEDVDVIFHYAGQVGVGSSIENPRADFEDNALGTLNVLEAARRSDKKPFVVYASTNKVYGEIDTDSPIDESANLSFATPYGCSKGAGEQYVIDYHRIYNLPTVVLRMSCIYGNRQFGIEEQGWLAHFMISCVDDKPITIYGDGTQVRDALYIDDYVDLMKILVKNKDKVAGQAFNVGGGPQNAVSIRDALKKIQKIAGKTKISYDDWRPSDQKYYVSDISKIEKAVGWKPKIGIDEGLERLHKWVKVRK